MEWNRIEWNGIELHSSSSSSGTAIAGASKGNLSRHRWYQEHTGSCASVSMYECLP